MHRRPTSSRGDSRAIGWSLSRLAALAAGAVVLAGGIVGSSLGSTAAGASCPATGYVAPKTLPRLYPKLVSGDRNFAGHGPAVTVAAKRKLYSYWPNSVDTLNVTVSIRAQETTSDWTTATGERSYELYRAPAGCRIVIGSAGLGPFDSNGYLARAATSNPYPLPAGDADSLNPSFVRGYTVWDDHSGDDVGSYTSVQVHTRGFFVRLQD